MKVPIARKKMACGAQSVKHVGDPSAAPCEGAPAAACGSWAARQAPAAPLPDIGCSSAFQPAGRGVVQYTLSFPSPCQGTGYSAQVSQHGHNPMSLTRASRTGLTCPSAKDTSAWHVRTNLRPSDFSLPWSGPQLLSVSGKTVPQKPLQPFP